MQNNTMVDVPNVSWGKVSVCIVVGALTFVTVSVLELYFLSQVILIKVQAVDKDIRLQAQAIASPEMKKSSGDTTCYR